MSWLELRVDLRAILAGVAADWLGTLLTAPILWVAFGVGPETADARIAELLAAPEFILSAIMHGSFFTALGGYVAARLAPKAPLRHAAIVGALAAVMAILLAISPGDGPEPAWWVDAMGYLLAVPAALAGGWLGAWRQGGGGLA